MNLTVTICTHNRAELLLKTISSINSAAISNQAQLSILVIANNCSDDTIYCLQNYQSKQKLENLLPLVYAEEPKPGKSNALNTGLKLIKDGWICFVDDDHRLDNHYFQTVINAITNYPETNLFCGRIIPDWTGEEPEWAHETDEFKITPYPVPYFDLGEESLTLTASTSIPGGGNLIVAREVFDKVGNFSIALGPKGHDLMGSEDSDFVLRALQAGETLRYIPDIIQYHYVNPEHFKLRFLIKKSFQRNRSITLIHRPERARIPLYLWSKLTQYLVGTLFSFNLNKSRFYLTRFAGVLGQIAGHIQSRP
ncbi:MAG: glycosyltransferase family 2 protein [Methyloprofundus sp.]|nr:glycosyltransferase family 2 protein [Methyloprofundus sp.]